MVKFGHLIIRSYLIHVYKLKKVTIGKDGKAQYYTEVLVPQDCWRRDLGLQ